MKDLETLLRELDRCKRAVAVMDGPERDHQLRRCYAAFLACKSKDL